jgi:hypothetical protein
MLNWNIEPRHWSQGQKYVTGDVLLSLAHRGWSLRYMWLDTTGRARMYVCTLERDGESMLMHVLDGPAVQDLIARHATVS